MQDLIKQLKLLKGIEPSKAFSSRLKSLLLDAHDDSAIMETPVIAGNIWSFWKMTLAMASILVLVVVNHFIAPQNLALAGLIDSKLNDEINQINTEIERPALDYYTNSNKVVASALDAISKDKVSHLNSSLLQKEAGNLNLENPVNKNIDSMLNDLTQ